MQPPSRVEPDSESRVTQSGLLDNENVIVLTKARFFRTLRILLDYAQHPERRNWEFFSYRPWDYILGTFCLTFDLDESAVSCGPQHPCLRLRPLPSPYDDVKQTRLEYAQPDFTLMSNAPGKEGELLFLAEAKPLGHVEPDTINALLEASAAFLEAELQRQRQARLAFERHSDSAVINILMICGSFWSIWSYARAEVDSALPLPLPEFDGGETDSQAPPSPTGSDERDPSSPDQSPPHKIPRIDMTPRYAGRYRRRLRFKPNNDRDPGRSGGNDDLSGLSPVPSPPSDPRDFTWRSNPQEEPLDIDVRWDHENFKDRKAGKKGKKGPDEPADTPALSGGGRTVHHILQLPNKDALNPWFRHFLTKTKDALIGDNAKKGSVQSSWFDWPTSDPPDGDGHAPGYVLPLATEHTQSDVRREFVELIRVDEPPEIADAIGSSLSPRAANALMSPRLSLPPSSRRAGSNYTGPGSSRTPVPSNRFAHFGIEEDTVLLQLPGSESSDDEDGITPVPTDDDDDDDDDDDVDDDDDNAASPTEEDDEDDETTPSPTAEQPHPIPAPQQRPRNREPSPIDSYLARKQQDPPQLERQPDSAGSEQPLPPQSAGNFTSHGDKLVSAAQGTAGRSASAQTLNDDAPPVASTPVLPSPPSPAVASGSRASTTTEPHAPPSSSSGTTRLSDKELLAAKRRREKTWALLAGPLLAKRLPNGQRLPRDFSDMSRADQELLLTLAMPRAPPGVERDYETAFRSTGMPGAQVRMMVTYVRGRHKALERSTGIAPRHGPSASRSHSGGGQRDPEASLTAAMPPPPPPTSLPRSAEGASRRAGGDDAQSSGMRPVSGEGAGPSTTTTDAASRMRTGSRARASDGPGAVSSSSRSAAASADDGSHSSAEPAAGSSQAQTRIPPGPRRQRRGDPVATTTAHMETLNLGRQASGTDPGEGSSNRKRKDRQ